MNTFPYDTSLPTSEFDFDDELVALLLQAEQDEFTDNLLEKRVGIPGGNECNDKAHKENDQIEFLLEHDVHQPAADGYSLSTETFLHEKTFCNEGSPQSNGESISVSGNAVKNTSTVQIGKRTRDDYDGINQTPGKKQKLYHEIDNYNVLNNSSNSHLPMNFGITPNLVGYSSICELPICGENDHQIDNFPNNCINSQQSMNFGKTPNLVGYASIFKPSICGENYNFNSVSKISNNE